MSIIAAAMSGNLAMPGDAPDNLMNSSQYESMFVKTTENIKSEFGASELDVSEIEHVIAVAEIEADCEQQRHISAQNSSSLPILSSSIYPWDSDSSLAPEQKIDILEAAADDGTNSATNIVELFKKSSLHDHPFIVEWIHDFQAIRKIQQRFKVNVGVSGPTGAGKSTLVNALLGYDELLPSGCEAAATATLCAVHMNKHKHTSKLFHAIVTFKSRGTVKKWLDQFYGDLNSPKPSRADSKNSEDGEVTNNAVDDIDDDDGYDDDSSTGGFREDTFSEYAVPIHAAWKYTDEDLRHMTTEAILNSDDAATKLLGTVKHISADDPDDFAEKIKPYLDTTPLPDVSTANGECVEAWPLIEHVDLYIESPILENGLVIEDLPGISDATELRAKVAEERFNGLDITVIVSNVIRAADEKNTAKLISDNDALRMELDGMLNPHQFCVAMSHVDQLDWEPYLTKTLKPPNGTELHKAYEELKAVRNRLDQTETEIKDAKKTVSLTKSNSKMVENAIDYRTVRHAMQQESCAKSQEKELFQKKKNQTTQLKFCNGYLAFLCTKARSERVGDKIKTSFKRCKSQCRKKVKGQQQTDAGEQDSIDTLPVSSQAFWRLKKAESDPIVGFPEINYTGIPALAAWIRRATIPLREAHARQVLTKLNVLLNRLVAWTRHEALASEGIDRPEVPLKTLFDECKKYLRENLATRGREVVDAVRKCNPLEMAIPCTNGKKGRFSPKNREAILGLVRAWDRLDPRNPRALARMHFSTHAAILRRRGERYKSSGVRKMEYTWIADMARIVLLEVVGYWDQAFRRQLPEEAKRAARRIEEAWDISLAKARALLPSYFPQQVEYLSLQLSSIMQIRKAVIQNVEEAMFEVASKAKIAHRTPHDVLKGSWYSSFTKALNQTGKGCYRRRQDFLNEEAGKKTTKLIKEAMNRMQEQIGANVDAFEEKMNAIWEAGLADVDKQINTVFSTIVQMEGARISAAEMMPEEELRGSVLPHVVLWQSNWQYPGVLTRVHTFRPSVEIPQRYIPEPEEEVGGIESDLEDYQPAPRRRACKRTNADEAARGNGRAKKPRQQNPTAKKNMSPGS